MQSYILAYLILFIVILSFYERWLHISFVKQIIKEKYYKTFKIKRHKAYHFFILLDASFFILFVSFLAHHEGRAHQSNDLLLVSISLISIISLAGVFDYRMRLVPDSLVFLVAIFSLIFCVYQYTDSSASDIKTDLLIKAVFTGLLITGLVAYYFDRFPIGLADIKMFGALIPLPYWSFDLSFLLILTAIISAAWMLFNKLRKSEEQSVPMVTVMALTAGVSFV
jgi:Flp pilus assembly protein protease CpaA